MNIPINEQLKSLSSMTTAQMQALWHQLFGRRPNSVRRDLMIKFLAYRLQERAYRELSSEAKSRLRELARRLESDPNANLADLPVLKPGTQFVRIWRGKSHCVTVLKRGYEYSGKHFMSLSEIARSITGTRWSGPLFFGLRKKSVSRRSNGT